MAEHSNRNTPENAPRIDRSVSVNAAPGEAYLAFVIPDELRAEIEWLVSSDEINMAFDNNKLRCIATLHALLDYGMEVIFLDAIKFTQLSEQAYSSSELGLRTVQKTTRMFTQRVMLSLTDEEQKLFSTYLNKMVIKVDQHVYFAFPVPRVLVGTVQGLIVNIRRDPHFIENDSAIVDSILKLIDLGILNYFETPIRLLKLAEAIKKISNIALNTIQQGIHIVINQLLKDLSHYDLILVITHIEGLLKDFNE